MKLSVIALLGLLAFAPAVSAQTSTQDKAISDRVVSKIANDVDLKADAVKVDVNGGVVTLTGVVENDAARSRAGVLAKVDGVTRVENKLTTRTEVKDKTKGTAGSVADKTVEGAKKVGEATKEGVSKTGEVITDAWITSRISTDFVNEGTLKDSNINVDTSDHVVTLKGTVMSKAGRDRAMAIAKKCEGVHKVIDKLTIGPKK